MIKGFLNIPWFGWAALALLVAVLFTFVWPHKAVTEISGLRYFAVRWAHALTWYLLALSFTLRGFFPALNGAANLIAMSGGLIYLLFITMTFLAK
jgi:hypothetical protein